MNTQKLVRMANQIAANFDYGGDRAKQVAGVVDHLTRFWTPDMKAQIIERAAQGDCGLTELAADAVAALSEQRSSAA